MFSLMIPTTNFVYSVWNELHDQVEVDLVTLHVSETWRGVMLAAKIIIAMFLAEHSPVHRAP